MVLPAGHKTVKIQEGSAVHDRIAHLDDTAKPDQSLIIDFVMPGSSA